MRARRERERQSDRRGEKRHERGQRDRHEKTNHGRGRKERPVQPRPRVVPEALPPLEIHFLPHGNAFENVAAQIKSGTVAYSLYALARLFLLKPERYDVRVVAKDEKPFFRLGESGAIASNRPTLENSAFRTLRNEYYEE